LVALKEESDLPAFTPKSATTGTIRLRPGFIDVKRPAFNVPSIQGIDGFRGIGIVGHLHKRETSGLSRITISDDVDTIDGTIRFE
jgi:hypothetical protein